MKNKFNNLNWHDAQIQSIYIDRNDPGKNDQIVLIIIWPNKKMSELIFKDCYAFKAKMNFGIIADETILDAEYTEVSEDINEIRRAWIKIGANLNDLGRYKIETNSTNSMILIYACDLMIKDCP